MSLSAPPPRGLPPTNLMLFSRLTQLPISLTMDLLLTAGGHVLRRDVANGTVQADIAVTPEPEQITGTSGIEATAWL